MDQCWITLPAVYCRSFASEVVFWAILKISSSLFTVPQGWKVTFARLQRPSNFSQENRISPLSNFAGEWPKDSCFLSYFSLEENSFKRPGASPRKIKIPYLPSGRNAKLFSRLSCWLPLSEWTPLFLISYCLTASNQFEADTREKCYAFRPLGKYGTWFPSRASSRTFGIFEREVQVKEWIFRPFSCEVWKRSNAISREKPGAVAVQKFPSTLPFY